MKLLLIGQSVEDHIFYEGSETVKPGGMFYTASGIISIKDPQDEIFLVTSIDDKVYHLFSPAYDKANTQMSVMGNDILPIVHLHIYDDKERDEKYSRLGGNLEISYDKLNSMDGILINMITGFDVTLDQLKNIRRSAECPVYMDVHTLSRGVDDEFRRPQRLIDNFSDWSENVDILQVNDNEVYSLHNFNSEKKIVETVLDSGTKYLLITRGRKGASVYYKGKGGVESVFVSALKVHAKNKVGCGDIFGAIFFHSFIKFRNAIYALMLANSAAGIISSYENMGEIGKLKNDVFTRHN